MGTYIHYMDMYTLLLPDITHTFVELPDIWPTDAGAYKAGKFIQFDTPERFGTAAENWIHTEHTLIHTHTDNVAHAY